MGREPVILMYHAIADDLTPPELSYSTPVAEFREQMGYLAAQQYRVLSLSELCNRWEHGLPIERRTAVITFDDGFDCLHSNALPILQQHGFPATVYMVSDYVGKLGDFDVQYGIEPRQMLSREQLFDLQAAGIEVGAHSRTHASLPSLSADALRDEILGSKHVLEDMLGRPVRHFAYPKGRYNNAVRDAVENAGYASGSSTRVGTNSAKTDRFVLRRAQIGTGLNRSQFDWKLRLGELPYGLLRSYLRRAYYRCRNLEQPIIGASSPGVLRRDALTTQF